MSLTPVPISNDIQVNTTTTGQQIWSSLAALGDGGFIVTWSSFNQDGSGYGVYGQRYTAAGVTSGAEFRVNTTTSNSQDNSSVAALHDGGFIVTWSSLNQDGSQYGVYGQRYTAAGVTSGAEFRVNSFTDNHQVSSTVTTLANGGFVVTWSSFAQEGNGYEIYGQRYTAAGAADGTEFRVNTAIGADQVNSSTTALVDGGFVVTWQSLNQDGSQYGVYGQRYTAAGVTSGAEFQVNSFTGGHQLHSSVAGLADGGFIVTWDSALQDGSDFGVYGQRYTAAGAVNGIEFRVNTTTANAQTYSSVTALTDGGFVVTWSSLAQDGSGYGIYGQRYSPDGNAQGAEFKLNEITAGNQFNESYRGSEWVVQLADGRLVATWTGTGAEEVFVRLIDVPRDEAPVISLGSLETSPNLIVNGGFEDLPYQQAPVGWTTGGGAPDPGLFFFPIIPTHDGVAAVDLGPHAPFGNGGWIEQTVSNLAPGAYTLSFWYASEYVEWDPTSPFYIDISGAFTYSATIDGTNTYQQFLLNFNVAAPGDIILRLTDSAPASGDNAVIDDFRLVSNAAYEVVLWRTTPTPSGSPPVTPTLAPSPPLN